MKKLLIQILIIAGLGLASTCYGNPLLRTLCTALRTSQAYEKGAISDERLQELYLLWKDDLNELFRKGYDTEDPLSSYADFKLIFEVGKKRVQLTCPITNKTNCDEQLQQIAESSGKKANLVKTITNTDDQLIELILEDTEPLFTGLTWAFLHYVKCDDNLDNIINEFTLMLQENSKKKCLEDL